MPAQKNPELAMMMSANSGIFTNSQALIALTRESVRLQAVIINTHLAGFKCKPAQRAAKKKTLDWVLRTERLRKAEPKSSAQILVTDSLGWSQFLITRSIKGLTQSKNSIELSGQPVFTPPSTAKRKEPSPQPTA